MIIIDVKYKKQMTQVTLYNEWDVREDEIVDPLFVTKENQRDKFVAYTDGWGLFGKIRGKTINAFVTCSGIIKRKDYCKFSRIQYPYTNYSGARCYDEHPLSRPFRRAEYLTAGIFVKTNRKVQLTPRIKMLVKDRLVEIMDDKGVDADWVINRLMREADNMRGRGTDRIEAIKILSRTAGVELERQNINIKANNALFASFNSATIQDQRRELGSRKELTETLNSIGLNEVSSNSVDDLLTPYKGGQKLYMKNIKPANPDKIEEEMYIDDAE